MRVSGIAVLAAAALFAMGPAHAQVATAYVVTDLNMREGPSARHQRLTVIPGGTEIDVYDCTGGWCSVGYGRWDGYVSGRYIELVDGGGYSKGGADVYYKGGASYGTSHAAPYRASSKKTRGYGGYKQRSHYGPGYCECPPRRAHGYHKRPYHAGGHAGAKRYSGSVHYYRPAIGQRKTQGFRAGSSYSGGVHIFRGRGAVRADVRHSRSYRQHGRHGYRSGGHRGHHAGYRQQTRQQTRHYSGNREGHYGRHGRYERGDHGRHGSRHGHRRERHWRYD